MRKDASSASMATVLAPDPVPHSAAMPSASVTVKDCPEMRAAAAFSSRGLEGQKSEARRRRLPGTAESWIEDQRFSRVDSSVPAASSSSSAGFLQVRGSSSTGSPCSKISKAKGAIRG